jgi:hypothetical protein
MAEIERKGLAEEGLIKERPEEVPPEVERVGVKPTQTQFKAQVTDDKGQPLIQTPQTQTVTVKIPATQTQLDTWAKGPAENALTWFAVFWIRIIKKALHFGWKMISGIREKISKQHA